MRKPFLEEYSVKLNYLMGSGYWKIGHIEKVMVPVSDPSKEKDNHGSAEALAKLKFPNCVIVSVTYC